MVEKLSLAQARRIALAAQGFGVPHPPAVGTRQLNLLMERLRLLQIDSVNVFERSHYLPVFARLGAYDKTLLDRLTFARRARYTETWAHVASIIPVEDWPLWRWRMEDSRERWTNDPSDWAYANRETLDWLRAELAAKGPQTAGAIEKDVERKRGTWWDWSDAKRGLEYLFRWGDVVSAGRRNFERVYGLAEHVLPAEVVERRVSKEDAHRRLVADAVRALGIGTLGDIADYFRLLSAPTKAVLVELVESGEVLPVSVEGWTAPAYLHRDARIPRRIDADALLSPFDPIVWERDRALRLFSFHYRIEIYTPAPQRVYGYYTLPVLQGDRLVGRVDLKSDRQAKVLRVQSAWREPGVGDEVIERLAPLLDRTREWQRLESIAVADRGDLAQALQKAIPAS